MGVPVEVLRGLVLASPFGDLRVTASTNSTSTIDEVLGC